MKKLLLSLLIACGETPDIPLIWHEYTCACDGEGTHLVAHACQPSEEDAYDAFEKYIAMYNAECETVVCETEAFNGICVN